MDGWKGNVYGHHAMAKNPIAYNLPSIIGSHNNQLSPNNPYSNSDFSQEKVGSFFHDSQNIHYFCEPIFQ